MQKPSTSQATPNAASYHVIPNNEDDTSLKDVENDTTVTGTESVTEESDTTKQKSVLRFSASYAVKLVIKKSLSINKAAVVCASLAKDGINVPTPSQSGVWRTIISGKVAKLKIKSILQEKNFCLK